MLTMDARDFERGIDAAARRVERAAGRALRTEGEELLAESVEEAPRLTGVLEASGYVEGPDRVGGELVCEVGFTAPYAPDVHDDDEAFHDDGKSRFLEDPLLRRAHGAGGRLAAGIRQEVGD